MNHNFEIIESYVDEILDKGNLSYADSVIADEFVDPLSTSGETGPEMFKKDIAAFQNIFPDMKVTIDEFASVQDKVAWKWTCRATHKGPVVGIEPTNKKVVFSGIIIDHIKDGIIIKRWGTYDRLALKEHFLNAE